MSLPTPINPDESTTEPKSSYFLERMQLLSITDEENKVGIWQNENGQNIIKEIPVFTPGKKKPGIDILVYTLDRTIINYKPEGSRWSDNYKLTRLETPITKKDGSIQKYMIPKGQGTYPFFHPLLIDKFEKQEPIHTIFLTEGFFKAWKGCKHGILTIGLSSITHMKESGKNTIHRDIERLIKICQVKRVVWLTDGDCLDITGKDLKDGIDLYKRPKNFFASCETFKTLLDDFDVDKYFFHIDTDTIVTNNKDIRREDVKGLDDLLCSFPDRIQEIADDITMVSSQSDWFVKQNITSGIRKILSYFRLNNPLEFYLFHVERRKELKDIEWIFNGTRYKWDDEKTDIKIVSPKDAKDYFRVGDQYYEFVYVPNKYGQLEKRFQPRMKSTIIDDHGKNIMKHIAKYKAFCNVPDHLNFQQVINNCFNVYSEFRHEMEGERCTEQDFPTILNFIKHVFGETKISFIHPETKVKHEYINYDLGIDYIQLLLQKPAEKLPIICLVSRANNTGKSTLGNFLKMLFSGNVAIVGNQDLAGDFNAHWASKLLVVCDETKIDKQHVIEKVKNLSTADKIMMNAKGKDHVELDCFIKFMFITNNEDSFININEDDIRYWVLKVPRIQSEVTNILSQMQEEIPAFLNWLSHRKLLTEKLNRMWFYPDLLKTEALRKVIVNSQPTIIKELRQQLRDKFLDFGVEEIMMTATNIKDEFFGRNRYEGNYLEKVLRDELKVTTVKQWRYNNTLYHDEGQAFAAAKSDMKLESDFEVMHLIETESRMMRYDYPKWGLGSSNEQVRVDVKCTGRPYRFMRTDFVSSSEKIDMPADMKYVNGINPANGYHQVKTELATGVDELPFN